MQGHKAVLFGVPDCGKVCSEQHVPSFLQRFNELRQLGVSRILCVAVGDEAAAKAWAQQQELADGSKIQVVTDPNAAFTRFMGMELAPPDAAGARSQRYAAVVDDGVLLKVVNFGGGGGGGFP
jgi:peroxiredoxin